MDTQNPKGENVASSAIFKKFLGKAEEYIKKPTRLKQLLTDAYQKASDKKDVGSLAHEAWETMQTLFRLIRSSASGEYAGLPTPTIVAAVAVVIYFLSPIDLIPDFIPVLGLLDDIALVAWFSSTVKDELEKFTEWEKTHVSVVSNPDHTATEATFASMTDQSAKTTSPAATSPIAAAKATETTESAKHGATTDLHSAPKKPSDTDSGISSPDSSNPNPSRTGPTDPAPKTDVAPHADVAANTTDSSRTRHDGAADTGGNVR
ncbi:Uncharacterized membrane protein YkvA, DUF1232 family [Hymenobacter daecheongensis DSM 21074]|uniref:Uncharacterized membrane protein YkvA, DUF1232 family n=1 Tax=Hymenobacter daecheongensis DSM 21074 TaxID=1121955 RepID=A0A1M6A7H1_9BACT|nr:Uncharacterized membrane protein YkvA, DUF1232 family [Hymenobacter daecheongensis DSM 21074]